MVNKKSEGEKHAPLVEDSNGTTDSDSVPFFLTPLNTQGGLVNGGGDSGRMSELDKRRVEVVLVPYVYWLRGGGVVGVVEVVRTY